MIGAGTTEVDELWVVDLLIRSTVEVERDMGRCMSRNGHRVYYGLLDLQIWMAQIKSEVGNREIN